MSKSNEEQDFIWPDFIKVGAVNYPPGGTLGPRLQSTIEFVMIHQGEMMVYIDGKPIFADANTITVFYPGHQEFFHFSKEKKTHHSYLHVAISNMPKSINERFHSVPKTIPLSKQMVQLTNDLLSIKTSQIATRDIILKTQSMHLFWLFLGEAELAYKNRNSKPSHDIIEGSCRFIETHLHENINLETIANAVSVCPEYLIRIFKQELDITPIAYLWRKRVALGIDLLEHSGLSINIIAERCGFKTRNHFSRKISEAAGNSPRQVRQRIWNNSGIE
jgi:AraC-like DNA-binding protein